MKNQAQNVFTDGLVTDYHPLTAKNTTLVDALNATLVTTKGNEMVLQNDVGNLKVGMLDDGYIPVGMKEYHGIIYICSVRPKIDQDQIDKWQTELQQLKEEVANWDEELFNYYSSYIPESDLWSISIDTVNKNLLINTDLEVEVNKVPEQPQDDPKYKYVDLGLSVKWATTNIGATSETDYGKYFKWSDGNGDGVITTNTAPTNIAGTIYDTAYYQWGQNWKMPNREQVQELVDKCIWKGIDNYKNSGVNGFVVTGPNGNSIFIPSNGYIPADETEISHLGTAALYWTSEATDAKAGYYFQFTVVGSSPRATSARVQLPIRPIYIKEETIPVPESTLKAVDLGLSVKWANMHLGATSEITGGYYGWGDPTGKLMSQYNNDYGLGNTKTNIGGTEYDLAHKMLGGKWRMPTRAEYEELIKYCDTQYTSNYNNTGLKCMVITGTTGNKIVIPHIGYYQHLSNTYAGYNEFATNICNMCWTSECTNDLIHGYYCSILGSGDTARVSTGEQDKKIHVPIRPVWDDNMEEDTTIPESEDAGEAVDLGLSVLWSTTNIGAQNPEDYGEYYAWGELTPKTTYTLNNYKYHITGTTDYNSYTSYKNIGNNISGTQYDAAKQLWGGDWRMPTLEEFNELRNNCTWEPVLSGGTDPYGSPFIDGYLVTSKINGNSIFLPSNGFKNDNQFANDSTGGRLWTATVNIRKPYYYANAIAYTFTSAGTTPLEDSSHYFPGTYYRTLGCGIRPVKSVSTRRNLRATNSPSITIPMLPLIQSLTLKNGTEIVDRIEFDTSEISIKYKEYLRNLNQISRLENLIIGGINYTSGSCQIGTYPSPQYFDEFGNKLTYGKLENNYKPLRVLSNFQPLETPSLNFKLTNPVNMEIQPSYDGSVNLILNDNLNIPRLINSGFAVKENGTYEIPERLNNDEQLISDISQEAFDIDTSLIRRTNKFPKVEYNGVLNNGNLKVGNYVLYFKYCDTDGNETDYIAESSIISIFKGKDGDPFSIDGGVEDMNANKSIRVSLFNLDPIYKYIKVYYTRTSSAMDSTRIAQAVEIDKKFSITSYTDENGEAAYKCDIIITGDENSFTIPVSEINSQYFVADAVKAQAQCQNMLFLGNVQAVNPLYTKLTNLSHYITPYGRRELAKDKIGLISTKTYEDVGTTEQAKERDSDARRYPNEYYNTKNIYYNTGYWNEEYYRLGIVYIFNDNTYSNVYNILGREFTWNSGNLIGMSQADDNRISSYTIPFEETECSIEDLEDSNAYNKYGVIHFNDLQPSDDYLYSIGIDLPTNFENVLQSLGIKGYFFVRQKRIPTIACQGYTLPWDKEAKIPILTYYGKRIGTLDENIEDNINNDYSSISGTRRRYVVESFMTQIGNEINRGKVDSDKGDVYSLEDVKKNVRNITHTYYTRLHYIPSWAIDYPMIRDFNGENDIIDGETEVPSEQDTSQTTTVEVPISIKLTDIDKEETNKGYFVNSLTYDVNNEKCVNLVDLYSFKNQNKNAQKIGGFWLNRSFFDEKMGQDNKTLSNMTNGKVDAYIVKHYYDLYKNCNGKQLTAICPEFEVRQPYFNSLFTGSKFKIKYLNPELQQGYLLNKDGGRIFYSDKSAATDTPINRERNFSIISVTDSSPIAAIENTIYKSVIGSDAEAYRFGYINEEHCDLRFMWDSEAKNKTNWQNNHDFNLVRGIYSPYLGINSEEVEFQVPHNLSTDTTNIQNQCLTFNIYYNNSDSVNPIEIRTQDKSAYYTVSDKFTISETPDNLYRGDCYLCTFTHRLNRNFNDPSAPANDHILDSETWRKNYFPDVNANNPEPEKYGIERLNQINRGDINAVKLGSWITIKVRSSYNLSIRSLDESHIQEQGIMGNPRGFYPLQQASPDGGYKIPNSYVINDGFGSTVGERYYENIQDAPYIKNDFSNRIAYSDINVQDAFKNNYRVFRGTHYRDYTKEYGSIVKLIELQGNLLCVFEHGTALIPVNERALAAEGSGGEVFINNSNVLPETPKILNDMYGSQWAESIVKTPYYVYGVDVARKKIWKTNGSQFEIISDFRVEKFLVDNLTISENDSVPVIGLKNIVTHYNANKSDVMFTFYFKPCQIITNYDCCLETESYSYTIEEDNSDELAWNLCYNEILDKFQTFYSWIPIASANIDNQFYSLDRECSRELLLPQESIETIHPQSDKTESDYNEPQTEILENFSKYRLTPYIWKHGEVDGILPYPCFWYGEQHPFEFEFVVNETMGVQKIFDNLQIISNRAEPESFHFTIVGDSYEFSEDKPTMYYRQELTKEVLQNLGSNITFNEDYKELYDNLERSSKSTILPLYYRRVNTFNDIYDSYTRMLDSTKSRDYRGLAGSEITWNKGLNEFNLTSHQENIPIDSYWKLVSEEEYNYAKEHGLRGKIDRRKIDENEFYNLYYIQVPSKRLRGNSAYKEDQWKIQIAPITLMQKNETWTDKPPIVINGREADDIESLEITKDTLPNTYDLGDVDPSHWTYRKECKIRDKYCKIRVRYNGTKLAIISAIITTFTLSYS